jgi:hypothetical protein
MGEVNNRARKEVLTGCFEVTVMMLEMKMTGTTTTKLGHLTTISSGNNYICKL